MIKRNLALIIIAVSLILILVNILFTSDQMDLGYWLRIVAVIFLILAMLVSIWDNGKKSEPELLHQVLDTFYPIINEYQLKVEKTDKHQVHLIGANCLIEISWHMGEIFVYIKESKEGNGINPMRWAHIFNKVDYKDIIRQEYSPKMVLGDIIKYNLFLESTYIRLFCKELLEGDFSKAATYFENRDSHEWEMYAYFENRK